MNVVAPHPLEALLANRIKKARRRPMIKKLRGRLRCDRGGPYGARSLLLPCLLRSAGRSGRRRGAASQARARTVRAAAGPRPPELRPRLDPRPARDRRATHGVERPLIPGRGCTWRSYSASERRSSCTAANSPRSSRRSARAGARLAAQTMIVELIANQKKTAITTPKPP